LAKGTVKLGYGFIAPAGGGNDVFVHVTALQRTGLQALNEGQQVEFETEINNRSGKPQASNIGVTAAGWVSGCRAHP
jgi:CspA family cold shock protein